MEVSPTLRCDWDAELCAPLPSVPLEPLFEGAPEGRDFRERESARVVAAVGAFATSLHLLIRGGRRRPTRLMAGIALFVGAIGLLSHRRWPEHVTLGGCVLAAGTMLVHPARDDPYASAATAVAALAIGDLRRVPRRFAIGTDSETHTA